MSLTVQSLYICLQSGELVTISGISLKAILKKLDIITVKLVITYLIVILISLSLFGYYIINSMSDYMVSDEKDELVRIAQGVSDFSESRFSGSKKVLKEELKTYLESIHTSGTIKITVYDADLKLLYSHGKINKNIKSTVLKNAGNGETLCVEVKDIKNTFDAACPIVINDEIFGVVNILYRSDKTDLKSFTGDIAVWVILTALLSGIIIFIVAFMLSRRIKGFTLKITGMTKDNRTEKLEIKGNDEISKLGEAFNDLNEKISVLEKQRTEFVSNASHELKTPLSSIKLMADSIIQTPDIEMDYVREFLSDMNDEVERLNRIVNKLLYITKMDTLTENMSGTLELINLKDVVTGINKNLLPIAEMESKELILDANEDILIMANKDILWQALYNIIDNALKYTSQYGRVDISLVKEGKRAVITVKDNGVGISEDDLERIFDRFYRVDKARSRATGGTGLGLSIAQSAIDFHNGTIEVTSELNAGSEFKIILPLVEWF